MTKPLSTLPTLVDPPNLAHRVQSVDKAFTLLECLAEVGGEASLSELSQMSGMPLPTVHRVLRAMAAHGYVRQLLSRRYALGPRLIVLGDVASRMLGACAQPYLEELAQTVGEAANISMLDGERVTYIARASSRHVMRLFVEVGHTAPPHCTAEGKVMLASLPESQLHQLLRRTGLRPYTNSTIVDLDEFADELARIRKLGYAVSRGEYEIGLSGVAVLVPDAPVPMAVSVAGPDARITSEALGRIIPQLQTSAEKLLTCT